MTDLMPGMRLMKTDEQKLHGLLNQLVTGLANSDMSNASREALVRLVGACLSTIQAAQSKIHLDAGFRGMGHNILTETAMRMPGNLRDLGRDLDRLWETFDPTATQPIPDVYGDWFKEHEPQLMENYAGMTVAILIRDGVVVGPVAAVKRGDYRAALTAAKALGYDLNQIQIENMPD